MTVDVEVEAAGWTALPGVEAWVKRAAGAVPALTGDVTVLLTHDATVRDLNAHFRGKDRPTNVLSFPSPSNPEGHLGDIALALETCAEEAEAQGKTLAAHLAHLTVHGVLHLIGHDHENDADAERMEAEERRILATLGISDPYADARG